jgi:RNA polymerase sigma factor (sigma-70 family)
VAWPAGDAGTAPCTHDRYVRHQRAAQRSRRGGRSPSGGRLRDRSEGEDIVQETYLRLYDYRRTRTVADVGAFCFAVARNLIRDHLRRLKRAPALPGELPLDVACPLPRADEILLHRQRVDILTRALKVMPPLRREVFLRRRLEEQPTAKIAADLELSAASIEKHVVRALADLRAALAKYDLAFLGER